MPPAPGPRAATPCRSPPGRGRCRSAPPTLARPAPAARPVRRAGLRAGGPSLSQLRLRLVEVCLELLHELRHLGRGSALRDLVAQLHRDALLELLREVVVDLAERGLDVLEVVEVGVADRLLGGLPVAG